MNAFHDPSNLCNLSTVLVLLFYVPTYMDRAKSAIPVLDSMQCVRLLRAFDYILSTEYRIEPTRICHHLFVFSIAVRYFNTKWQGRSLVEYIRTLSPFLNWVYGLCSHFEWHPCCCMNDYLLSEKMWLTELKSTE